jgi:hypothetical protein
MNRISRLRLVLVIATLTAVLTAPLAEARGLESPRAGARVETNWLAAAMSWLEGLTGWRRPAPRSGASTIKGYTLGSGLFGDGGAATPMGGTCIDPQGEPIPWCGIGG